MTQNGSVSGMNGKAVKLKGVKGMAIRTGKVWDTECADGDRVVPGGLARVALACHERLMIGT